MKFFFKLLLIVAIILMFVSCHTTKHIDGYASSSLTKTTVEETAISNQITDSVLHNLDIVLDDFDIVIVPGIKTSADSDRYVPPNDIYSILTSAAYLHISGKKATISDNTKKITHNTNIVATKDSTKIDSANVTTYKASEDKKVSNPFPWIIPILAAITIILMIPGTFKYIKLIIGKIKDLIK